MKAFVSNVDSPLGYSLSRLLSQTTIGSRREEEQPPEEDAGADEEVVKKLEDKAKLNYSISGTLTQTPVQLPGDPDYGTVVTQPSAPGTFFETADKKKAAARREAIQKFAVPGKKPAWVSDIVPVNSLKKLTI